MLIVLLLLLAAVAAAALALLWLVVRGHNKRLLLAGSHAVASDTPGGIGISVLCSGVHAQEQVENLLSAEYAHYEVIVVLDSLRYPVEFAAFTARYRMIRVEYALSEELPVTGVRALGRSRKRRFRRLVLVDRAQDTPAGDFDAAAEVAAYDPVATEECRRLLKDRPVRYARNMYDAADGADAILLVTEWKEFRMPDWPRLRATMRGDGIVDGRNIFDKQEALAAGFRYRGIGK